MKVLSAAAIRRLSSVLFGTEKRYSWCFTIAQKNFSEIKLVDFACQPSEQYLLIHVIRIISSKREWTARLILG